MSSAVQRASSIALALVLATACGGGSSDEGAIDALVDPDAGDDGTTSTDSARLDSTGVDTNGDGTIDVGADGLPPGDAGPASQGGTITFANVGAPGFWGRRILASAGDPRCDVESKTIDLGAAGGKDFCCRTKHTVTGDGLTPFDAPMTLILRGPMRIAQFAVYQPGAGGDWARTSFFDAKAASTPTDLHLTGPGDSHAFTGDIGDQCSWYAMRAAPFACGPSSDPYCPASGPDVDWQGWAGSKLLVFRATLTPGIPGSFGASCGTAGAVVDAPWIGFSASELMRDGWGKYYPCHCYDNTDGTVGAGCGEVNVFETVPESEGPLYGNRGILSTGVRSYQVGSFGGSVCGFGSCKADAFPASADLLDACSKTVAAGGVTLTYGGKGGPCPVWKRPTGERFLFALFDVASRTIKIGMIDPRAVQSAVGALLPALPATVPATTMSAMVSLQLPG